MQTKPCSYKTQSTLGPGEFESFKLVNKYFDQFIQIYQRISVFTKFTFEFSLIIVVYPLFFCYIKLSPCVCHVTMSVYNAFYVNKTMYFV